MVARVSCVIVNDGLPAVRWQASTIARRQFGFTLIELVTTMILVGILAVVVLPRMPGRAIFDTRGFSDQMLASLQFARQVAVAQRRQVCVSVTTGGLAITRAQLPPPGGVCDGTALINPTNGSAYALTAPSGVVVSGAGSTTLPLTLRFDPLGRPNSGALFSVNGDGVRCVAIEAGTGYVRGYLAPC